MCEKITNIALRNILITIHKFVQLVHNKMKQVLKAIIVIVVAIFHISCNSNNQIDQTAEKHTSIYHWKSTFELDSAELAFLQTHNIDRIYLKLFDVATEHNFLDGTADIVPIATTKFVSAVPKGAEIVPVVYITIDALRAMEGREAEFANLIVERSVAMCNYNKLGKIRELQLDCDWTSTSKDVYCNLCKLVKESLQAKEMVLSITVRLHQLKEAPPTADSGVLMLYNTGALTSPFTKNSILDIKNAKPFIKTLKYPIPLNYAYPAFGWGVKFDGHEFVSIVAEDAKPTSENEHIRVERPTATEILEVKTLVEQHLGKPANGNILYHLDDSQLKNYTDNEISQILAY